MNSNSLHRAAVLSAALCAAAGCAPHAATVVMPAACAQPSTPIGTIRGVADAALAGERAVTAQGVVTGDFEGPPPALQGFWIQDGRGGADPLTSAAIFVFNGERDDVAPGDVVRVVGSAGVVDGQARIVADTIVACGTGTVAPTDIVLPVTSQSYLARHDGMLVRLPQTLYVTEHYQLGRFGEVVLSSGSRLAQPTQVAAPGPDALAIQAANDLNRITVADAAFEQNPATIVFARGGQPLSADNTLRGGDHVTGLVGVLTRTSATGTGAAGWRVRPLNTLHGGVPDFVAANPRPRDAPAVGGTLRVAAFNLLNYFNTFDGCTGGVGGEPLQCRGAADAAEFERQWRKTVAAITAMRADIVGIVEIENDGYAPASAIAHLVGRLNDVAGPGRFGFIDVDAATGQVNVLGTDAIKVGLVYRTDRVSPVASTAALNTPLFVNGGESGPRSRPALAQAFADGDGGVIVVSVNHFKSKGGGCDVPDAGDGQGNCNSARVVAAQELAAWLAGDPTGSGTDNVLIIGDLNSYAREDPVAVLERAGYTNLVPPDRGGLAYSYVFNGQWGSLDHALASPALVPQVTGTATWHINADEPPVLDYSVRFRTAEQRESLYRPDPYRSSDHDPIIVGVRLTPAGQATSRP